MLSTRLVMVNGSGLVLVTTAEKVKVPPGSGRLEGCTPLSTRMEGAPVRNTVAWAWAEAVELSLSTTMAVTTSVWLFPATPLKSPGKVHGGDEAPAGSTVPIRAPQVEPARVARLP